MTGIRIPLLGWVVEFNGEFSEHGIRFGAALEGDPEWVESTTNRVLDSNGGLLGYILVSEHDGMDGMELLSERYSSVREEMGLGPMIVIKSSHRGWHTIIPEVRSYEDALRYLVAMQGGHSVDGFMRTKTLALRTSEKNGQVPRIVAILGAPNRQAVSFGHLLALERDYGLVKERIKRYWGRCRALGGSLAIKKYIYHRPLIR